LRRTESKIASTNSRRLAEIHHRQADHEISPKFSHPFASPGGTGFHCQALPQKHPKTHIIGMSRLAAMYGPPGGFWKISRNQNFTIKTIFMHSYHHIIHGV